MLQTEQAFQDRTQRSVHVVLFMEKLIAFHSMYEFMNFEMLLSDVHGDVFLFVFKVA